MQQCIFKLKVLIKFYRKKQLQNDKTEDISYPFEVMFSDALAKVNSFEYYNSLTFEG